MKTLLKVSLLTIVGFAVMSCAPQASTNTGTNTNTGTAPKAAAPPTTEALMALDNKAWEAWKNKDGKYFEAYVAENFVGFSDGKRSTKADLIKMISENKCEVKSVSLSDPHITPAGPDVAVLTYKAAQDGTCDGQKLPANVTAATVFVRSGDTWKGAYHNEVPVMDVPPATGDKKDPAGEEKKESAAPPVPEKKEAPAANSATTSNTTAAPASGDGLTDALMAVEKKGWEGWMKKDAAILATTTGKDLTFVDVTGKATAGQDNVIKLWTDGTCKVSSVNVSDGEATMIAPNVAILTFKGTAEGTCGTMKIEPIWGTTVAVKEGDTWKAVYIFETPIA